MALNKSITLPNGTVATYWMAVRGDINQVTGTTWIVMRGYVSQTQYNASIDNFVIEKPYTFPVDPTTPLPLPAAGLLANVFAYMEGLALTEPDFSGATQS